MENLCDVTMQELTNSPSDGLPEPKQKDISVEDILAKQVGETDTPRLIDLTRSPHFGFGFTLRHFIVYPPEPSDEKSELEGVIFNHSSQPLDTIFVKQVRVGSPAYLAGLTTGDRVVHVNECNVCDHSYQEIVTIIQRSEITLRLVVVPGQHDILQQVFGNTAHNPQSNLDLKPKLPSRTSLRSVVTSVISTDSVSYQDTSPSTTLSESFEDSPRSKAPDRENSPIITYQAFSSCVSNMPALPAHRVTPNSVPGRYGTGYPSKGHSHARKKPAKEPKKNPPLIVDRKQAVYNISQGIKSVQKNKIGSNSIPDNNPVTMSTDNHLQNKNHIAKYDSRESVGVYEPVMVRIEIKGGVGERKKLEKHPDGRLYEVVQTRMVENDFDSPLKRAPTPDQNQFEKGYASPVSNLAPRRESFTSKPESFLSKADGVRSSILYKAGPDDYGGYDCSKSAYSERSAQEAISRIKRNVEKKEEFLMRPNDVFSFPPRGAMVYRQYQVCPQKLTPRPIWPPTGSQSMESLDNDSQTLSPLMEEPSVRRMMTMTKSNSLDYQSLGTFGDDRPISLPASPTTKDDQLFFPSGSVLNIPPTAAQTTMVRPLVRNSIAKPYASQLVEDVHSKCTKPYFSTLSRIQENLPESSKELNIPSGTPTAFLPTTTWTQAEPRFGSESSLSSSRGMRSIPMAWVAENDRVKKLQIVSTRAKKFESGNQHSVPGSSTKFELDRLSQQDINVAKRKEEFERKDPTSALKNEIILDKYGLPTTFEGIVTYVGTRSNPVGGPKIHCEPPHKYRHGMPDKVLERDRSHSVCSHATLWKDRSSGSDLVRQHSFHSTIRSHIARAVGTLHKVSAGPFDEVPKNEVTTHVDEASGPQDKKPVSLRGRIWLGDEHERLVRRVSYLKATSTDRVLTDSDVESDEDKSSRHLSVKRTSAAEDLPSPASFKASIILHGHLNVKLARHRGKRAGDRSWKSVWGVIRGRALLFYKDKQIALQTPLGPDDQVTLRGSEIAVASDYTKKKNVLRLSTPVGSQFLLQAESEGAMTAWLTSLKSATAQGNTGKKDIHNPATPSSTNESPVAAVMSPTEPSGVPEISSPYGDSDSLNRSMKKVTSPTRRTRSPSGPTPVIKTRKPTDVESTLKSKTWKVRIGRHLRKMQAASALTSPSSALPHGASIGVCLEDCPPSNEKDLIPLLVALCVGVVESKGLHIQGIYRIPGNKAAVNHLTDMVNQGPHAIDLLDPRWSDVNVISSLLKQFFQKLPDPLIPSYLYCHFIDASKSDDPHQRLSALKNLVHELPDCHFETLRYLISHFGRVAAKSNQNRMDVKNLAIVFGPTLVRAADDSVAKLVTDMSHQCRIVESLIAHESWFFSEDEIDNPPPIQETRSPSNDAEMEFNSQTLLLNNLAKLEGNNYKDTKKMVSSLISAANRIHKNRGKKIDDDHVTQNNYHATDLSEPTPMSQRRISGVSLTTSTGDKISGSSLACHQDDGIKERCGKSNSVISGDVMSDDFPASMGGSSYLGDELAIRSYAGLSARTQERIRQFERETRAMMLQRDILSRQESQKLESHRKKVEDQLQKAKQDMENEDIFDKMAKNPSEVVPRIGDLLAVNRASTKETVRFPSCSIASDAAATFSSLTNSFATNSSAQVANKSSRLYETFSKKDNNSPCLLSLPDISYGTVSSPYNTMSSVHSGNSSGYGSLTRKAKHGTEDGARLTKSYYDSASLTSHGTPERDLVSYPSSSPHLAKNRKGKKVSKKRSNSSASRGARETILKHILPFHSKPSSSVESLVESVHQPSAVTDQLSSPSSRSHLTLFNKNNQSRPSSHSDLHFSGLSPMSDSYSIPDSHEHPINKVEGSDLLRDITETFEEKMRNLQESPYLTVDSLAPPPDYEELKCENYSNGKENSISMLDAKCHLYRDPSLHRRCSPVDSETFYNYAQAVPDKHTRSVNLRRTESVSSNPDRRDKDKSEKRSRELHRIDTQDILREKKPKEWKRSKTQEIHYPIELLEKFGSDLKSRKQNVRQLKEKFERSGGENSNDPAKKANATRNGSKKKSRIKRRHTVGGTQDLARVALLRVIEAQRCDPAATWQQIQALIENLTDKRYINPTIPYDGSSPDLNAILSLVAQPNEPQLKHLSVKDATQNSLHAVLESHV